jgi:hypothetical protein
MEIPVLVEPVDNNGYRARSGEPLVLEARGATAEEAVKNFKALLATRIAAGANVVAVEVPGPTPDPWLKGAGMYNPEDPLVQQWMKNMADYRREIDEDPNVP